MQRRIDSNEELSDIKDQLCHRIDWECRYVSDIKKHNINIHISAQDLVQLATAIIRNEPEIGEYIKNPSASTVWTFLKDKKLLWHLKVGVCSDLRYSGAG